MKVGPDFPTVHHACLQLAERKYGREIVHEFTHQQVLVFVRAVFHAQLVKVEQVTAAAHRIFHGDYLAVYGFAGMYDSGGYIPRGQFGIVGENGPEIVNGPANVTSRRNTAALAAVVAGMMGVAAAPAELPPLHPLALPAKGGEAMVSRAATVPPVQRIEAPMQIIIQTQPGQSAQDIAREVARQLDERERRLKAKARSNYSDQGGYDA